MPPDLGEIMRLRPAMNSTPNKRPVPLECYWPAAAARRQYSASLAAGDVALACVRHILIHEENRNGPRNASSCPCVAAQSVSPCATAFGLLLRLLIVWARTDATTSSI